MQKKPVQTQAEREIIAASRRRLELAFGISFWFTAALWWIQLVQTVSGWDFTRLGVEPHAAFGLIGVLLAPLLHASWEHLLSNTLPVLILGTALLYGYPRASRYVIPLTWLGSGLGVWFTGRPAFYVGASGLVMGFIVFLLVAGALRRDRTSIAITCAVAFLYGTALVEIVPQGEPHIAYVAHAWGGAIGLVCALVLFRLDPIPPRKRFHWQHESEDFEDPLIGDLWRAPPSASNQPERKPEHDAEGNESPPRIH
ncbi:MAG: rhomboid family intramembrane serine protease [Gammaproteobacteria bacterium]